MHSLKLPSKMVHGIFLVFIFVVGLIVGSIGYNVYLTAKTANYKIALTTTTAKAQRIDHFEKKAEELKLAVTDMHLRNNQLRRLLGLKLQKPSKNVIKVADKKLLRDLDKKEKTIFQALNESSSVANADKKELRKLKDHVTKVYQQMVYLPSKWPVRGRIVSRFGYRYTPWRGFHTGIDIDSKYGYPIRASADGVVTYSGWRRGYGKTVEIKHKYGYSTLYAHCSSLLVSRGERIKASQIIGKIGVTGYSTGSHLHYEVRKNKRPINPYAFLDLKVLTAARLLK